MQIKMWTSSTTGMLISTRRLTVPLGSTHKKPRPIWSGVLHFQITEVVLFRCGKLTPQFMALTGAFVLSRSVTVVLVWAAHWFGHLERHVYTSLSIGCHQSSRCMMYGVRRRWFRAVQSAMKLSPDTGFNAGIHIELLLLSYYLLMAAV